MHFHIQADLQSSWPLEVCHQRNELKGRLMLTCEGGNRREMETECYRDCTSRTKKHLTASITFFFFFFFLRMLLKGF